MPSKEDVIFMHLASTCATHYILLLLTKINLNPNNIEMIIALTYIYNYHNKMTA